MRIIAVSTALAFAAVLGSVACVDRTVSQGLVFRWRWIALPWMALGVVAGWYLWRLVWAADNSDTPRARRRLIIYLSLLAAGGIAVFVFPIVFVPSGQFREVLTGLIAAILVLGFVGWMIFRLGRLFSGDGSDDSGDDSSQSKS
jgi:hypothetical protein